MKENLQFNKAPNNILKIQISLYQYVDLKMWILRLLIHNRKNNNSKKEHTSFNKIFCKL